MRIPEFCPRWHSSILESQVGLWRRWLDVATAGFRTIVIPSDDDDDAFFHLGMIISWLWICWYILIHFWFETRGAASHLMYFPTQSESVTYGQCPEWEYGVQVNCSSARIFAFQHLWSQILLCAEPWPLFRSAWLLTRERRLSVYFVSTAAFCHAFAPCIFGSTSICARPCHKP